MNLKKYIRVHIQPPAEQAYYRVIMGNKNSGSDSRRDKVGAKTRRRKSWYGARQSTKATARRKTGGSRVVEIESAEETKPLQSSLQRSFDPLCFPLQGLHYYLGYYQGGCYAKDSYIRSLFLVKAFPPSSGDRVPGYPVTTLVCAYYICCSIVDRSFVQGHDLRIAFIYFKTQILACRRKTIIQ